ncbi:MAG TPA: response regulator transcription factor [Flavobacteriaceae bacterium]|nr:response regulator transcription factor [Flavobacteriaceae bacterium]
MHVLIVEDDIRVAELIGRVMQENSYRATITYNGQEALELVHTQDFDLIITDIILPKLNGVDFCRQVRIIKPHIPIIMLTALGTTNHKVEGLDAGADDYMVKPFEMKELLARVRAVLKRSERVNTPEESVLSYADLKLDKNTKTVKRNNKDIKLTPKEFQLLEYFLSNPNRVLSRAEIAENVWQTNFDTGTNFIDVYINYLRNKIDKNHDFKLIHTRVGMGFILHKE